MQSRVEGEDVKELASALRIESAFCANICLDCASAIAACETKRSIEAILAVRPDCVKAPAFQELPHSRLVPYGVWWRNQVRSVGSGHEAGVSMTLTAIARTTRPAIPT